MTDLLERPVAPPTPVRGRHRKVEPPRRVPSLRTAATSAWRVETFALTSAVVGALSLVPLAAPVRAVLLAAFVLSGPGLATVLWIRLPAAVVVAVVPVTGLAVVAGATAMLGWSGRWLPVPLLLSLIAAVTVSALLHARSRSAPIPHWPASMAPDQWRVSAPYLWIVVALCVWAVALPGMADAADSPYGLLFTGTGPVLVMVTTVLVGAFVTAVRRGSLVTAALAIGAVIAVLRLTATLVTDLPIYPWTYKHLGIVDYLLNNHSLPPSGVDVYREWPAFFTTFAWFCEVTALDPTTLAHWFAPATHLVLALLIGALAATLGLNRREALTAVMVAEVANWVAQDYFAPQAFAFVLGLGVVVALVASPAAPAAGWLAFGMFTALVPTHQLTPFWVFGVVVVLVLTRQIRPWWVALPYGVVLIGYLIPRSYIVFAHGGLSSLNPVANGSGNTEYAGSAAKMFTSLVCRGLSATVVLLALVAAVVWWRRKRSVVIPVVLAMSPFVLLMLNSYGGEAIFRVYLYALPGCAVLIAPLAVAAVTVRRSVHRAATVVPAIAATGLAAIAIAGLQGYYGIWNSNVQKPSQLALINSLTDGVRGPVTVWNLHTAGFPSRATAQSVSLAAYDDNYDSSIFQRWPGFDIGFPDSARFDEVTALAAAAGGDTYFVFTHEAKAALDYLGHAEPQTVERFEDMFAASPVWCIRLQDETTTVFRYQKECS